MTTQIPIQKHLMRSLPFDQIQSRLATATILSYVNFKEEVIILLQSLSHSTRAYLHNAGGLPGFLQHEPIVKIIIREGLYLDISRYQDCSSLRQQLNQRRKETLDERLQFLKQNYPATAIKILRHLDRHQEAKDYMDLCKKLRGIESNFSQYVHGYFLPWLDQQRAEGKISKSKSTLLIQYGFKQAPKRR